MRKFFLSLLLAGAMATPALADPGDHDRGDRADHPAARAERQEMRSERTGSPERPNFVRSTQSPHFQGDNQQVQQNVQADMSGTGEFHGDRSGRNADGDNGSRNFRMHRGQMNGGAREGFEQGTLRQSDRPLPPVMQPRTRSPMVSDIPREGTQPPLRAENRFRAQHTQWSTAWRNDHRFDWRDWRRHHRSWFHLGFYFDPFGWGYQPYSIGWRLWPSYYSSNYWLSDPYEYRLPYAPPGTRWIRYYNDAILVDTFTGEVVDVIYNFFW